MPNVPRFLYKYLAPERLSVLKDCKIRFTQRKKFDDDHELKPDYLTFGTLEEIKRHIARTGGAAMIPGVAPDKLAALIYGDPKHQKTALQTAVDNIKILDELG